jgi:glucokinase
MRHASMLEVNEFLVLDHVRAVRETTRTDLVRSLGLSPASVSRIVRRLAEQRLVVESPGESRGGRPRVTVQFNSQAGSVIGIDLGGTKCHGMLADLAGEVFWQELRPTDQDGSPERTLAGVLRTLTERAERMGRPLQAVAVGVPAVVDPVTGLALGGPNVHWDGFPIVDRLRALVDVPVAVDNDVNLAALGHAWRGDARGRASVVTLAIGTGIGAAIVLDGRIVKGSHGAAGEVGYLVLRHDQLGEPARSGLGAFERIASGPAIVLRASELLGGTWTPERVFAAAATGDPGAEALLRDTVDHIAMALIAIVSTVDPEVVILEGSVGRAFAPYVEAIRSVIADHVPAAPEVVVSSMGGDATTLGAVAAALRLARDQKAPPYLGESLDVA